MIVQMSLDVEMPLPKKEFPGRMWQMKFAVWYNELSDDVSDERVDRKTWSDGPEVAVPATVIAQRLARLAPTSQQ